MKHLLFLALFLTASALHAQRAVQKNPNTGALTESLATGANTLTISAAGTLTWTSGATLSGASAFRDAAGLTLSAGGLGASDAGKVAIYDPVTANLSTTGSIMVVNGTDPDVFSYLSTTEAAWLYQTHLLRLQMPNTATAGRIWKFPNASGDIITTGNLSSITATGTVTSGTWSGAFGAVSGANLTSLNASNISSGALALARIAQGGATSGQVMSWNGTAWAPAASGGGLTIGTTAITGGTSGRVLYNNGGVVGELTTTGSGDVVRATSPSFTTSIIVNKSGQTEAAGIEVADDPENPALRSLFLLPPVNNGRIYLGKSGQGIWALSFAYCLGLENFPSSISRGGSLQILLFSGGSLNLDPDFGAGQAVNVGSSTTAALFRVNNSFTSGTSYESGVFDWRTTSNTLRIGTDIGSGGGTARDVQLIRGGVVKQTLGANTTDHAQPVKAAVYTVATLPAAATVGAYSIAAVSDADTPVVGSTVTGGGSAKALVCSNGTAWLVIAVL
jgi:hypothetical protein